MYVAISEDGNSCEIVVLSCMGTTVQAQITAPHLHIVCSSIKDVARIFISLYLDSLFLGTGVGSCSCWLFNCFCVLAILLWQKVGHTPTMTRGTLNRKTTNMGDIRLARVWLSEIGHISVELPTTPRGPRESTASMISSNKM